MAEILWQDAALSTQKTFIQFRFVSTFLASGKPENGLLIQGVYVQYYFWFSWVP